MYHSTGFMWFMWLAFCGKLSFSQAILEVELEEKSYAMCLKHAEELQLLSHQWEHTEVLTRTEFDEAAVAIKKVPSRILVSKLSLPFFIIGHWNGNMPTIF